MDKQEIWKEIKDYEGLYFVSNFGNVKNAAGHVLKGEHTQKGYARVGLSKNGEQTHHKVHRLVADAFIPNPYRLPQVNHIDEDKTNNIVSNLCWVDNRTNSMLNSNRSSGPYPVTAYNHGGNKVGEYGSVYAASKATGIDRFGIVASCRGMQRTAGGYLWRFAAS